MNNFTVVSLATAAVFVTAFYGIKLADALFGRVPANAQIIAAMIIGALAFGAGAVAAIVAG